jgi:hypothetical protein
MERGSLRGSEPHGYTPALDGDLGGETESRFESDLRWRTPGSDDGWGLLQRRELPALVEI